MGGQTYSTNPTEWAQDTKKYCGIEANVTDPSTGNTISMYIGDAFADEWVKVSRRCPPMHCRFLLPSEDTVVNRYHDRCFLNSSWEPER